MLAHHETVTEGLRLTGVLLAAGWTGLLAGLSILVGRRRVSHPPSTVDGGAEEREEEEMTYRLESPEVIERRAVERLRRAAGPRSRYVEGCESCRAIAEQGGFGPSHSPSPLCRSGGRAHCTCDACF